MADPTESSDTAEAPDGYLSEGSRAVRAAILGGILGAVLALLARRR
jgi:hypothetical protein